MKVGGGNSGSLWGCEREELVGRYDQDISHTCIKLHKNK